MWCVGPAKPQISLCICTDDQSICYSREYSMSVKLLTEHRFDFVSLKGGCTESSESYTRQNATLLEIKFLGSIYESMRTIRLKEKETFRQVPQI